MSVEEIVKGISDSVETIKNDASAKAAEYKALADRIGEVEKMDGFIKSEQFEKAKDDLVKSLNEKYDTLEKDFKELAVSFKHKSGEEGKFTFKEAFKKAYEESKSAVMAIVNKKSDSHSMDLKAVADMSQANFTGTTYADLTTEIRPGVYQTPFSPLWLRNVLPGANTSKGTIKYVKETGGEGAAAVWTPGTTATRPDKPQVDYDFEVVSENVDWIAGIVRIPREMLDDIEWLQSYVINQIIYGKRGILVAENAMITAVLDNNSTAYNGDKTIGVEMLYDAAFGQLRDNYHTGTHIVMNHRDMLTYIAFNKANGSGEYDLPLGTVAVVNNVLYIGGVAVIGVPSVAAGSAYVMDANQTQFVTRMGIEVMTFEQDRDNVIKNLITIRGEERATAIVFDDTAVIKVTLPVEGSVAGGGV